MKLALIIIYLIIIYLCNKLLKKILFTNIMGLLFLHFSRRPSEFCEVRLTKSQRKRRCKVTYYFLIFNSLAIFL
jgi:hypothetical protein